MNPKIRVVATVLMLTAFSSAMAAGFDTHNLYFGGGLSQNEVSGPGSDTGTGVQVFAGYELLEMAKNFYLDVEAGYMQTGNMDITDGPLAADDNAKGPWATAVARYTIAPQWEVLVRTGVDLGDDDGFMIGAGGGFIINKQMKVRLEYVERDHIESIQANFIFML
jgi:hypothetical protein